MEQQVVAELISKNMSAFYGYAFDKLYDKDSAEDLTSEIICEILASAENLENDEAFWGYAWKIAENTFRKFIRRNKIISKKVELNENTDNVGFYHSPLDQYIEKEEKDEQTYLLRRELSLLSSVHRKITVSYYIHNKSCAEIASEQNMSVEMVKYHLFKSRKILKEGVSMTRKLGEKSYNPGVFRVDFWGNVSPKYRELFDRSLPGAIMLAAYEKPLTAEELSIELGVAMPYLEEELEILESAELIKRIGTKYQTNIVIITDAFEKDFLKSVESIYTKAAKEIFESSKSLLGKVRQLKFKGNDLDDNRLLWLIISMVLLEATDMPESYPDLVLGGCGYIYGYDNDYINVSLNGISHCYVDDVNFCAVNYRKTSHIQNYMNFRFMDRARVMKDAILQNKADETNELLPVMIEQDYVYCENGIVYPNFYVFDKENYKAICELLAPVSKYTKSYMKQIFDKAAIELVKVTPSFVKDQCENIAQLHYSSGVMGFVVNELIDNGSLIVPKEKTNLAIWGINHA